MHIRSPSEARSISQNGTIVLHDNLDYGGDYGVSVGSYKFLADGSNARPTLSSLMTSFTGGLELATAKLSGRQGSSGTFVLPPDINLVGVDLIVERANLESSGSVSFAQSSLILNLTTVNLAWSAVNSSITVISQTGSDSLGNASLTSESKLNIINVPSISLEHCRFDASSTISADNSGISFTPDAPLGLVFNLTTLSINRSSLLVSNTILQTKAASNLTRWTLDGGSSVTLSRLVTPTSEVSSLSVVALDASSSVTYDQVDLTYSDSRFDIISGPVDATDAQLAALRRFTSSNVNFIGNSDNVFSHATFTNCNVSIELDDAEPLELHWSFGVGNSVSVNISQVTWFPITPDSSWHIPQLYSANNATIRVRGPSNMDSLLQLSSVPDLTLEFPDSYLATGALTSNMVLSGTMTLTQGAITVSSIISGDGNLIVVAADSFTISSPAPLGPSLTIESVKLANLGGAYSSLTLNRSSIFSTSSIVGDTLEMESANFSAITPTASATFNAATISGNCSLMAGIFKLQTLHISSNAYINVFIPSWQEPTAIEVREPISFDQTSTRDSSSSDNATVIFRLVVAFDSQLQEISHSTRFLRTFGNALLDIENGPISYELYGRTTTGRLVALGNCFTVTYNASGQGYYLNANPPTTGCALLANPDSEPSSAPPALPSPQNSPNSPKAPSDNSVAPEPRSSRASPVGLIVGIIVGILILAAFGLIFFLILLPAIREKMDYGDSEDGDRRSESHHSTYSSRSVGSFELDEDARKLAN